MTSQRKINKVKELGDFLEALEKYRGYLYLLQEKGLTKKQKTDTFELRNALLGGVGQFKVLITELTGKDQVTITTKLRGHPVDEHAVDMWLTGLRMPLKPVTIGVLSNCIDVTRIAISKLQDGIRMGIRDKQGKVIEKPPKDTAELPVNLFDKMRFHPKIINASRALFEDEHYAQAIFEAFKAVENFVQDKSGLTLYGTNLMERVFNEENPIIKVPEAGHYYKEVQRGFKHLFIGASQGIRNPKAHKETIQKDPYITLQYLGFFSFLLKRIDYWEAGVS